MTTAGDGSDGAAAAADVRALRARLTQSVEAACDELQSALAAQAAAASARAKAAAHADYDVYHACCQRLVAYIAANMATSPDFAQQMERVILMCHSGASQRVLRSVATKRVWFHRGDLGGDDDDDDDESDDSGVDQPTRAAAAAVADASAVPPRAAARGSLRALASDSPMKEEPPPPSLATKRRSSTAPSPERSRAKKPRTTARRASSASAETPRVSMSRVLLATPSGRAEAGAMAARRDDDDGVHEIDFVGDAPSDDAAVAPPAGRPSAAAAVHVERLKAANRAHLGDLPAYLLNFEDPLRGLCDVDARSPAQAKAFKERLRKAVAVVDAQACRPPRGSVCTRSCRRLKAAMCARTIPCANATCRQWHDVEVHLAHCASRVCELDKRIVVRETTHKAAELRELLERVRAKLAAKLRERHEADAGCERERLVEAALLANEVDELRADVASTEMQLAEQDEILANYWRCLAAMGIDRGADARDGLPDPLTHYAKKKTKAAAGGKKPAALAVRAARREETSQSGRSSRVAATARRSRLVVETSSDHDESDGRVEALASEDDDDDREEKGALVRVKAEWAAASSPSVARSSSSGGARPLLSTASWS